MAAEPAVSRLSDRLEPVCNVVGVSVHSDLGKSLREKYGANLVPTFILLDGEGNEVFRQSKVPTLLMVVESLKGR